MAAWQIIAKIHNDFSDKFGIPRQSGLVPELQSLIVFEEPYRNREALRGIEEYSHLWLLWQFSEVQREGWSPTVRPPRLGGNRRMGVFATRSPFRPNPIGLSSVKLLGVEETAQGLALRVAGADLMDGTPIVDIKPYLAYTDAHPEAVGGFADAFVDYRLSVTCDEDLLKKIPTEKRESLLAVLEQDPRPSYQHDPKRVYALDFGGFTVHFRVEDTTLIVLEIQ
ncbi:MAG: tRNA (N6-threonylcarbamoyladenosine(37)-N6)-methyltransferase TrmO [Clostridia bacterium]|nr:tRNA (N6-threonylcarbamoyladenosine(37)-N6)-methyltransferase TrmO [Clostridia bacterium]